MEGESEKTDEIGEELTSSFKACAEILAKDQADELSVKQGSLFARDPYIKRKTAALLAQFVENFKKSKKVFSLAGTLLQEQLVHAPEKEAITQEISHVMEILPILENEEELKKQEELSATAVNQELLGLSDATLLWMYQVGNQFFKEKNFENAYAIFRLLVQLNPLVCDYWIAFALAQVNQNEPSEALDSFAAAIILDRDQPTPRYQSAMLYLQLGQKEDALAELEVLEEIIQAKQLEGLKPALAELKKQIEGTG